MMTPEAKAMMGINRMPSIYAMIIRMTRCLSGAAEMVGAAGMTPAKMLLPSAKTYLASHGGAAAPTMEAISV